MKKLHLTLSAVALLGLVACSDDSDSKSTADDSAVTTTEYVYVEDDDATTDTTDTADTTAAAAGDATVVLAETSLGEVLATADGMTLYLFTTDTPDASTCNGGCASSWPPLTGEAVGGEGLDASLFSTITRDDGSVQVAYNGHPLYLFVGDTEPGAVTGQGVGGVWFAVNAAGDAVE